MSSPRVLGSGVAAAVLARLREPEPKNLGELAARMRQDYQVQLALTVLGANLHAARVTVAACGDERARQLAERLQRLWHESLPAMLEALPEGRVAFEKVWSYDPNLNLTWVRKLDPLPFAQSSLRLTPAGAFNGIELAAPGGPLSISVDKAWWLALDPTPAAPHGRSRFLGAPYQVWRERQEVIRLRQIFIRKLVVSGGVAHVPDRIELENGESIDVFAETARAHDDRLAGGLMIFPNSRDAQGRYEYDYTEPPGTLDPRPLDDHLDGLDQEQLQAFGVPPRTVLEGSGSGSYALVSQHMLTLYAVVEGILSQFEASFLRYVIDKQVDVNFPPDSRPVFSIAHQPLAERPDSVLTDIARQALTSSQPAPLLTQGLVDLRRLLQLAGIPLTETTPDPGSAVLEDEE